MKRILLIPHFSSNGGAGLYIKQLINLIKNNYDAQLYAGGKFAEYYNLDFYKFPAAHDKVSLPCYEGVTARAYYFNLVKLVIYTPVLISKLTKLKSKPHIDVIILTSSIQTPLVPFLKFFFKRSKIIIIIQENLQFNSFILGSVIRKILNSTNLVISITEAWSKYAVDNLVPNILLRNLYPQPNYSENSVKEFDFIYLGGDQRIKGFYEFVDFCGRLPCQNIYKIAILGKLSRESKEYIYNTISKPNIKLSLLGFVDNPEYFIHKSKILIIPITSPHFCRPAIEAGFSRVPFLIKRHSGIGDFAVEDYNCLMYEGVDQMVEKACDLLDRPNLIAILGHNNFINSQKFIEDSETTKGFVKNFGELLR